MMTFDEIWHEFDWVIDELRDGMAHFEGYIPSVRIEAIEPCLHQIAKSASVTHSCEPCWRDATRIPDVARDYSISECASLFREGKLTGFDFFLDRDDGYTNCSLKLMFYPSESKADVNLTIICFTEHVLESPNPKEAIGTAISEMRLIRTLLHADALYVGPDGLDLEPEKGLRID